MMISVLGNLSLCKIYQVLSNGLIDERHRDALRHGLAGQHRPCDSNEIAYSPVVTSGHIASANIAYAVKRVHERALGNDLGHLKAFLIPVLALSLALPWEGDELQ